MTLRTNPLYPALIVPMLLLLSCKEEKLPVHITQYTDPCEITAIAEYNGDIYSATKGGLVKWILPGGDFTILTTSDGLPSNNLSDVLVDDENKLWVSSDSGVGVFDGSSWKRYGPSDGLPSQEVTDLSIDNDGIIWVGTEKGLATFKRGGFDVIDEEGAPVGIPVECVYFDRGGNMWVGTSVKGVFVKKGGEWNRTGSKEGLVTDSARTIIQSWDNSIWAASWAGISRWDGFGWQGFKPMQRLGTYKVRKLLASKNRLWFFTDNGIHTSKGSEWRHYTEDDGLISNDVNCGILVSDDHLYVGTAYGMSIIKDGVIENYVIPNRHFGNNCISLATDDRNRIWVGTWETGLNLFDSGYWSKILGESEDMLATVRDFVFVSDGSMVFNTKNGIVMQNEQNWKTYTRQNGLAGDDIRCGIYDNTGTYWAGSSTGICSFSNGRWKRYRSIHGLPSEDIWDCTIDSEGTVWFGSSEGIISIAENAISDRSPELGIDELDVRSVKAVGPTVYFGTENGRLITYSQGTWDIYGSKFLKTDKGIYTIAAEPSGVIWFGTNGDGIIRYEGEKTSSYTIKDGLPSNFVRSVAWSDGALWAACYGGVAKVETTVR